LSVHYYGRGDHGGGFVGFRVTKSFNGDYRQAYFSTIPAKSQSDEDIYFRYQRLKAEYKEAEWEADSLWYQYQQFVTKSHGTSKPYRGLGIHGITAGFALWHGGKWEPCFMVSRAGKPSKRFMFRHHPFSEAWALAVNLWAEEYQILEVDRIRVLASPPDPEHFKKLRRQMNDHDGFDISVEALGPVFSEQREQLARERLNQRSNAALSLTAKPSPAVSQKEAEIDMLAWFETERKRAG
jgi:hypothetical protein